MKKSIFAACFLALGLASAPAHAGWYFGGLLGYTITDSQVAVGASTNDVSGAIGFGARVGTTLTDAIELGGYFTHSSHGIENVTTVDAKFTGFGVEGIYNLMGSGFGFGARLGLVSVGVTAGGVSVSSSEFALTPLANYDFELGGGFMVGPELSYTIIMADGGSIGNININAAITYSM